MNSPTIAMKQIIPSLTTLLLSCFTAHAAEPAEFLAWSNKAGFTTPKIVLQFDPQKGAGFDWKLGSARPWYDSSDAAKAGTAVEFVREGIERMCGQRLDVVNSHDLTRGIVFTTLAGAGDDIRNDAEVVAALKNDGSNAYNDREAFFIRSEPERLLIVANTAAGLGVAAPALTIRTSITLNARE